jgi:hypothetical protein
MPSTAEIEAVIDRLMHIEYVERGELRDLGYSAVAWCANDLGTGRGEA